MIDYSQFVTVGQTHSFQTHHRFYVKKSLEKKRKYDEGTNLQNLFQTFLHDHPLPSTSIETSVTMTQEEEEKEDEVESSLPVPPVVPFNTATNGPIGGNVNLDSTVQVETNQPSPISPRMMAQSNRKNQDNYQLLQAANYRLSINPLPEQTQAMNEMDFGLARKDIEKDAKRFDWIEEELNYLEHYILDIEADSDKKNRFAVCLQHIRTEAPSEVKQYFHPHHLANSDRLKNGYNAAMKRRRTERPRGEGELPGGEGDGFSVSCPKSN